MKFAEKVKELKRKVESVLFGWLYEEPECSIPPPNVPLYTKEELYELYNIKKDIDKIRYGY
jgi:hypothetical protein